MARLRTASAVAAACALLGALLPAAASAMPRAVTLSHGWEIRGEAAAPAPPQPPPPVESDPGSGASSPTVRARASQTTPYFPTKVPSVFDSRALPPLYPGTVKRYRLRFRGPRTPRGFRWLLYFGEVRRAARVYLNGRLIGRNNDPYTPFTVEARGLRPGKRNILLVTVDSRKNARLREGWWNWGGIVRAVKLIPAGHAYLSRLGLMSRVHCRRPGRACRARFLLDSLLERRGGRSIKPSVWIRLRSPKGRVVQKLFKLKEQRSARRGIDLSVRVPAPALWSPDHPNLYSARIVLRDGGNVQQIVNQRVGLRSVQVKHGHIYLNSRRINLRGASIHEDMPGEGAALSNASLDRIVSDLKSLGANVTRAHYLLDDRLLRRFDKAGIMVWNEAPIWQRDNLLHHAPERLRAWRTVRRTVEAGRSHPSVITHSVANELKSQPDTYWPTGHFLTVAAKYVRQLDPTLPVAVDIKGRPYVPEQFTYKTFDILGLNTYFGWYRWVRDFSLLEPYLQEMRDLYPQHALVMTEFGAEGLPEMSDAPLDRKGGYRYQAYLAGRTLDVVDRSPILSGAIYWTLREFEIYPGWTGGASAPRNNTRHHKGLLTYFGDPKPAWYVVHDHFLHTPLYAR